jgi:hypothetical protein
MAGLCAPLASNGSLNVERWPPYPLRTRRRGSWENVSKINADEYWERTAALWKIEIQRVSTARTIEAILVAIAVRGETESRQTSGLCSRNDCDRGAERPSRIS